MPARDIVIAENRFVVQGRTERNSFVTVYLVGPAIAACNPTAAYTVAGMRLANEAPPSPTGDWEPYVTPRAWTLTAQDAERSVWVQYRDTVGNESLVYSDTITLDRIAPSAAVYDLVAVGDYSHRAGNTLLWGEMILFQTKSSNRSIGDR